MDPQQFPLPQQPQVPPQPMPAPPQYGAYAAPPSVPQQRNDYATMPPVTPASMQMPTAPPSRPPIANPVAYHMGPVSIKRRVAVIAAILAGVGLFIAGGFVLAAVLGGPGRYSELQSINVESTTSSTDGAYQLQLPKEFTGLQRDADSVLYIHAAGSEPGDEVYARASATAVFVGEDNMTELRTELTAQAVKKSGAVYQGFIEDQVRYIVSDAGGDVAIADVIEASATAGQPTLEATFTHRDSQGDDASGKILVVFGAKHLYILTAVSATNLWETNQAIWNQVFSNFTVDISNTQ